MTAVLATDLFWVIISDGYKHINETEPPFRFVSVKRTSVSVSFQPFQYVYIRFNTFQI